MGEGLEINKYELLINRFNESGKHFLEIEIQNQTARETYDGFKHYINNVQPRSERSRVVYSTIQDKTWLVQGEKGLKELRIRYGNWLNGK